MEIGARMKRMLNFIDEYCFSITLNVNDFFHPAADSEDIDNMEIPGLLHAEEKFGSIGVMAFVGVKRKYDPTWRGHDTKEYYKAKKYIEDNFYRSDWNELVWKEVAIANSADPNKLWYYVDLEEFAKKEEKV